MSTGSSTVTAKLLDELPAWKKWWLARGGYFAPSRLESLALFLAAVLSGLLCYNFFVRNTYVNLFQKYRDARVTPEILLQDPAFPPPPVGETIPSETDAARLFRSLQLLKLLTEEDTLDSVTNKDSTVPARIIFKALEFDTKRSGDRGPDKTDPSKSTISFSTTPTVELLVYLVFHIGGTSGYAGNNDEQKALADLVAAILANQPGAADELRGAMVKKRKLEDSPQPSYLTAYLGDKLGLFSGFVFDAENPEPMSDVQLIAALYQIAGVDEAYDPLKARDGKEKPEKQAELKSMTKFLESLVERLRGDHAVKKVAKDIPLWKGYEQACMWVLFWWTLAILLYREGRRFALRKYYLRNAIQDIDYMVDNMKSSADQKKNMDKERRASADLLAGAYQNISPTDSNRLFQLRQMGGRIVRMAANSVLTASHAAHIADSFHEFCNETRRRESGNRWFIRYLTFALPAVGFIGTKRGIAGALSQADLIVRAQDPGAQAAAIGTVTSILGIAFTTTLIALVMGLIINLINSAQMYAETAVVDRLEESLAPLVNPARSVVTSTMTPLTSAGTATPTDTDHTPP